jgi:hypothetical protein
MPTSISKKWEGHPYTQHRNAAEVDPSVTPPRSMRHNPYDDELPIKSFARLSCEAEELSQEVMWGGGVE